MDSTHVLISRPEPECSELAERLAAEGFQAICLPAFEFRASGEEVDPDGIWRNSEPRLAVFTSTRSVTFGLAAVPADFFDEVLLASVGPATSHLLQTAGMRVTIQPESDFSSEGLLAHPLLSSPVAGGASLIFAAPCGRDALHQGLEQRGWETRTAMVYQRVGLEPLPGGVETLLGSERVISLWTSTNAMDQLLGGLPDEARERVMQGEFVVASERLAEAAHARGAQGGEDIR